MSYFRFEILRIFLNYKLLFYQIFFLKFIFLFYEMHFYVMNSIGYIKRFHSWCTINGIYYVIKKSAIKYFFLILILYCEIPFYAIDILHYA